MTKNTFQANCKNIMKNTVICVNREIQGLREKMDFQEIQ